MERALCHTVAGVNSLTTAGVDGIDMLKIRMEAKLYSGTGVPIHVVVGRIPLIPRVFVVAVAGRNVRGLNGLPLRVDRRISTSLVRAATADDVGTRESGVKGASEALSNAIGSNEEQTTNDDEATGLQKDADAVKSALDQMKEAGTARQWDSTPSISRRTTVMRELTNMGIKNAEELAIPSVRNDAAFLATVVGVTSVVAVAAGQLPGDWGFFVPYLVGSISLLVLVIGSTAPGLLQAAISKFASAFPDYEQRVIRHEAAHFLAAYLMGLPVLGYSVDLGREHVNLVDEKLQERIYRGSLDASELDKLAVVSMAGLAAEGLNYEKVEGQSADLFSLQRLINRSKPPLNNKDQQNLTRWAVLYAASLVKTNSKAYEALQQTMAKKASVIECVESIEKAYT